MCSKVKVEYGLTWLWTGKVFGVTFLINLFLHTPTNFLVHYILKGGQSASERQVFCISFLSFFFKKSQKNKQTCALEHNSPIHLMHWLLLCPLWRSSTPQRSLLSPGSCGLKPLSEETNIHTHHVQQHFYPSFCSTFVRYKGNKMMFTTVWL